MAANDGFGESRAGVFLGSLVVILPGVLGIMRPNQTFPGAETVIVTPPGIGFQFNCMPPDSDS